MLLDNLNREARAAIADYVARPLVAFVSGTRGEPVDVSSGTLLKTPAVNIVVLTAKHCVDDVVRGAIRLCWYGHTGSADGTSLGVANHPSDSVDIAMFALWPAVARVVGPLSLNEQDLASDDDVEPDNDALILARVPASLLVRDGNLRGFWTVNYGTNVGDPPRDEYGRPRVLWTEMETPAGNVPGQHGAHCWSARGLVGARAGDVRRAREKVARLGAQDDGGDGRPLQRVAVGAVDGLRTSSRQRLTWPCGRCTSVVWRGERPMRPPVKAKSA